MMGMGPGMAGMAAIDRIEGRIAFLRLELKITEDLSSAWNAFADALRTNSQKLGQSARFDDAAARAPPNS